jgi:hypothetical protein
MLRTNRSCPGTSTNPRRAPGRSRKAKPRSIVIPRRFSSSSLSGFVPVSDSTSVDLPWSMWPAVPTMTCLVVSVVAIRYRGDASGLRERRSNAAGEGTGVTYDFLAWNLWFGKRDACSPTDGGGRVVHPVMVQWDGRELICFGLGRAGHLACSHRPSPASRLCTRHLSSGPSRCCICIGR